MRRFFVFLLLFAGIMLFFIDMKHGQGSALYQLYGFAYLALFISMALALSGLPGLARRPFFYQFLIILCVVLLVGGIIELIQAHFGRTASWRDLET